MTKIITHNLLRSWSPCSDGYKRFCELFPEGADLKTAVEGLISDGHNDWGYWLFSKCRDKGLFSEYAANGDINSGHWNSGNWNSGNWNSGHWNSGDMNSGYRNSGDINSGDRNSGNWNSGNMNSGDINSGDRNSGHWNSGDINSGDRNSGNWNSGHWNSGDRNSGDRNSGNWNSGNWNSGHFNTKSPDTILVFNKPCSVEEWNGAKKPDFLYFSTTEFIQERDMSDAEKIENPKFYVIGGYLKTIPYKKAFQKSWENASAEDRELVKKLPNFDADVFFKISGIKVR